MKSALIIEDLKDTRDLFMRLLSGSYQVLGGELKFSQASSFEEGDLIIQNQEIDLVYLDLTLPPFGSRDTAMKFSARHAAWPATIIVTGNPDDSLRRLCIGAGCYDYWDKDLALHTLPAKALIERSYNAYLMRYHGR